MKFNREIMKGHLKTILLAILEDGPCHAYGLDRRIQDKSLGVFSLPEGTAYPSLSKLEKEGLIESSWESRDKGPDIKVYHLTSKGLKVLADNKREWRFLSKAMEMVLRD
ncbi:MAG: PadR family transcriptional regulator [bacterium]|nr:PadR family transcriptional regulator [bacterium]